MANRKILVIGGVAAGPSAASKAKRIDPETDVKIIQDEKQFPMALVECPMSLKV